MSGDEKREFHFETRVLDTVTISSLSKGEKKPEILLRDGRMKTTITTNEAVSKPLALIADLYCFNLLVFLFAIHFVYVIYSYFSLFYLFIFIQEVTILFCKYPYLHTSFTQRYQY